MTTRRIFKYTLSVVARELVQMPADAIVLSVGVQNEHPVVWAEVEVDPETLKAIHPVVPKIFRGVTTGESFNGDLRFVGTVTLKDWFVFHIFEEYPAKGTSTDQRDKIADDYREIANAY